MIRTLLLSIGILFSCNSVKDRAQQNMPFEMLLQSAIGGRVNKDFVIIYENNALKELYADIHHESQDYQVPEIDFNSSMVIALFMGEKTTGGYQISIDSIKEVNDTIIVNYTQAKPEKNDGAIMAITQPYCIIKMPRASKKIEFVRKD